MVEARYVGYTVQTKAGLVKTGFLLNESATSLTLVGADGKPQTILRTEIEEMSSSGKSAMPEGIEKDLQPQDVADLHAFLRSAIPQQKRKVFEGNNPEVVRANPDGSFRLMPSQAEIFGSTLVLEKQYGNLGFWASEDDHAAWTVDVPKSGKYAVTLDWACDNGSAGNTFVLQVDAERLTGKVAGTGTWDNYKQTKIGEMRLQKGEQRMVFRSVGKITGSLIDLRGIRLAPVREP